jgi:hypothetical protein
VTKLYRSSAPPKFYQEFLTLNLNLKRFIGSVEVIQSNITMSIMRNVFTGEHIENSVKVLDIFNSSNRDREDKIDYKDLYNDAINREINLKEHFYLWIQERQVAKNQKKAFDKYSKFTFCSFPWILDAANKSELLRHQNRST